MCWEKLLQLESAIWYASFWDSCDATHNKYTLNGYISFNSKSCFKYLWMVNGNKAGNSPTMNYPITAYGKYSVCVLVTDTCHNCDTTYCNSTTITCIKNNKCNWKQQGPYLVYWDSCSGKKNKYSLNAYSTFTTGRSCHTYQWTVNSSTAGTHQYMNYSISQNGNYVICVKVKDTRNKCDTTYCRTIQVHCVPAGINKINLDRSFLKVYINPSDGIVKFDWTEGSSSYNLVNTTGQILQTGILENGTNTLDLNRYPSGLYLKEIRTQSAIITGKISIQRK